MGVLNEKRCKKCDIIIKHFPNIQFTSEFLHIQQYKLNRESHWFSKIFQYHKFHLFQPFFKRWDYVFYIDCGMHIVSDIAPMLNEACENTLLAHSDAYNAYVLKLHDQFSKENSYFYYLKNKFNLDVDYPQSTILLYDTKIITETTFNELMNLAFEYPISITNDQGIIALYFTNIMPVFKQIKLGSDDKWYYDFSPRNAPLDKYIMVKRLHV